jgi:hypothetical protein
LCQCSAKRRCKRCRRTIVSPALPPNMAANHHYQYPLPRCLHPLADETPSLTSSDACGTVCDERLGAFVL